jgi:hypothetical protein
MAFALRTLFRRHQAGRQFQMLAGLFPVYLAGTVRALVYPPARHPKYSANNGSHTKRSIPAIVAIMPQVLLIAANAILPFYALTSGSAPPRLVLSNALISGLAIWSLLPAVFAALGAKSWDDRQNPYALHSQPANASS